VTGLGHSVGNGDWVTKIEAQTIILDPPQSEAGEFNYTDITIDINPTTGADTSVVKETKTIVKNTNTGGTTKTFNGKVYQNGKVDELLVRMDLTLEKQHKTSICQSDGQKVRLQAKAMQNLEKMLKDAKAAGIHLGINSAYRTYDDQVRVKAASAKSGIPAATPGRSNHGFGLAVDLGNSTGARVNPSKTPKEWAWVQANKHKYSFSNINDTNESHHYNFYG
jgi:LAS superfamily LD-carboxypeptidase LdcB